MHVFQFRFDRLRSAFAPRKPRHPLLRVLLGLVGLGLLLVLLAASVLVGVAMLTAGVLYRLWRLRGKPVARDARVVDGEYRVVGKPVLPASR